MARSKSEKGQLVEDFLKANPKASNTDVVKALAGNPACKELKEQFVYAARRAAGLVGSADDAAAKREMVAIGLVRRAGGVAPAQELLSQMETMDIMSAVTRCGGIDALRAALDAFVAMSQTISQAAPASKTKKPAA